MRIRRVVRKQRREDLSELLAVPGLATVLASDFAIVPPQDSQAHAVYCDLRYFDEAKSCAVSAQFSAEIDAERNRLSAEGWPPRTLTLPTKKQFAELRAGSFSGFSTAELLRFALRLEAAWLTHAGAARGEWELQEQIRRELWARWGFADQKVSAGQGDIAAGAQTSVGVHHNERRVVQNHE